MSSTHWPTEWKEDRTVSGVSNQLWPANSTMLNNNNILALLVLLSLRSVQCRQVCDVSQSKLGEGYNILTAEKCGEYCSLVPQCLHWTWYRHHCPTGQCAEQDFVRDNICYALTDCRLVEEQCSGEDCRSGHKSNAGVSCEEEPARSQTLLFSFF